MNAKRLRDSILQYAMQGKLVSQVESDEPASKLIDRIKAEKELLIKQKVIKKEKPLPLVTEEEIPFEIPENWCWIRLGEISYLINGDRGKNYPGKQYWIDKGVPFINAGALGEHYLDENQLNYISEERFNLLKNGFVECGDILYCLRGSLGKVSICNLDRGAIASSLVIVRPVTKEINPEFLMVYFNSFLGRKMIEKVENGTAQPNISAANVREYLVPFPPVAEQERILAKIEKLMDRVNLYEEKYSDLSRLQKLFPNQLEKSILQYATQGKLVPQIESDEPASLLVERIKAEKERLVKEKVIKKEKALPPITEEEIPFDIPESWEWVRLGQIGFSNIGVTYKPSDLTNSEGTPILRANNIQNGEIVLNDLVYIQKEIKENEYAKKGDILICARNGSERLVGKSAIVNVDGMGFGAFMAIFRSPYNEYIQEFIQSDLFRSQLTKARTTTINQVTQKMLKEVVIPLPPLQEQKAIVKEIRKYRMLIRTLNQK